MGEGTHFKFEKVAPSKQERESCWRARDAFWTCIKDAYSRDRKVPDDLTDTVSVSQCSQLRKAYESVCPQTWIQLFDRQHDFKMFGEDNPEVKLKEQVKDG